MQNCNFGQIRYVCLSNHLEISSRRIKSCCNNNLDKESTFNFSHYMDTKQSERCKFKEIAKIQILEFFTKLNARHTWSLLIRCVNMKLVRLVLWKIHSGHDSVHRRTDDQGETSTPPFNFVERGYNEKKKRYEMDKTSVNLGHRGFVEYGKPNTNKSSNYGYP